MNEPASPTVLTAAELGRRVMMFTLLTQGLPLPPAVITWRPGVREAFKVGEWMDRQGWRR